MSQIVIDPVTRIEGHLRIEAKVEGGKVTEAYSSGTMFRGMELILRGKDPREAWIWAQRICGVCTTVHAHTSVTAVEDALQIEIPENARLIRNLISGAQYIQDHVIHFYHLHALDWVDVSGCLKADPKATSDLAQSLSPWPKSSTTYFAGVQARVKKLVDSGQLSLFTSGAAYFGHPAYKLPPEADLMAVAHYLEALEWQRDVIRIHSVLGGKNPHLQTYLVGGMAAAVDPNSPNVINPERIAFMRERIKTMRDFVEQVYIPDVKAVASFYPEWAALGAGHKNYLSYGGFQTGTRLDTSKFAIPQGIIMGGDLSKVLPVDQAKVAEAIAHSYYTYDGGDTPLNPFDGQTNPKYTQSNSYQNLNLGPNDKYSWLKSPRYDGQPMEVGPLARMLVAYASGNAEVKTLVDSTLTALKLDATALFSTLGRVAARALETAYLLNRMDEWIQALDSNMSTGTLAVHNGDKWDPATWGSAEMKGWGFHEAPRGALGHWVRIKDGKIVNYQAVVPSTWNAGPRDANGVTGPYEASLVDTPVADETRPIELLRTIHSFDPCLACAVHVVDATGRERAKVEVEVR